MPERGGRDDERDNEFLTIAETRILLRESANEHRQLAETQANLSRAITLLEETVRPIRKLVDGNGRGPLGERIVVLEGLVRDLDRSFREWIADFRQKAQELQLGISDTARIIADRETRISALEEWKKSHTRFMWAILTPALGIVVAAVLYGVAKWITQMKP